jgi:hypothetical protein
MQEVSAEKIARLLNISYYYLKFSLQSGGLVLKYKADQKEYFKKSL